MGVIDTCFEDVSLTTAAADEKRDFIFEDRKIVYVLDQKGTIWIRSREIADILLFSDDEDITLRVNADEHAQFYALNPNIIGGQADEEIQPQTVFLSHSGIHILVLQSENHNKMNLARWMVNVVVPSIRQLEWKSKNEKIEELRIAYETVKAENSGLRSEIRSKILQLDEHINAARMQQRYVQFLREEKRASDISLELQLKDAEAMQRQIQILISESRNKREEIEDRNIKIRNLEFKIRQLETENQSKDAALDQGNLDTKNMQNRIQDLEAINRAKDETLEQQIYKIEVLQNDIVDLKNENSMLKLQRNEREVTAENYGEISRKQEMLFHLLRENFIPKPYDKKLENQFLIFALNADDFFPYYAVNIRNSDIDQQMKIIRARHPNSVELLRIPLYSNAVNLLNLMKNHMKDKIGFRENFFVFRDDQYTDDDLKRDVLKLFSEAEKTRQEVFRMMCIERDFRSTENKCPPTTSRKDEVDTEDSVPVDETAVAGEKGDDLDTNPPPADETVVGEEDMSLDSNPPPADETVVDVEGDNSNPPPADEMSEDVEGDNSIDDSNPPPPPAYEREDIYFELDSESDLYESIVHEANA